MLFDLQTSPNAGVYAGETPMAVPPQSRHV